MNGFSSKSALLIPRVGTMIRLNRDEIFYTVNKQKQIRLKYVEAEDTWIQVSRDDRGFILWLPEVSNLESMTHVRVSKIMASGRTAWGELLSIPESI